MYCSIGGEKKGMKIEEGWWGVVPWILRWDGEGKLGCCLKYPYEKVLV